MTDNQKRTQRGELMVDLEDAQAHVAALRVSLKTEADRLSAVAEWLYDSTRSINVDQLGDEFFARAMSSHVNIVTDQRFQESMNLDRVVAIRRDFIAGQKRIDELASRLRELRTALA